MKESKKMVLVLIGCFLLFLLPFSVAFADDDNHKDPKKWYEKIFDDDDHDDDHESKYLTPVNNETFKQECGACHFAYQPGLLPAGSWGKILSNLPAHFGEEVSLDQESKNIINEYLQSTAAENSSAKRARKILKSLGEKTPLRITKTPYIQEKHHELDSNIFSRQSIGSPSNCIACHPTAEQGNYDDDFVKIPK
ncbi:diheme cytochrome c [Desulfobacula sp.]|uniref:diheme cytochrome c n=1 Tax=Desulfobacula sp. TaxID=2593537 RepID=UPI002632A913|nr:diheme cytochrome c [Desulfobacula sp.]